MNLIAIAAVAAFAAGLVWAHGFRTGRNTIKDSNAWKRGFASGETHGLAAGAADREQLQDQYDELRTYVVAVTGQIENLRTDVVIDTHESEAAR